MGSNPSRSYPHARPRGATLRGLWELHEALLLASAAERESLNGLAQRVHIEALKGLCRESYRVLVTGLLWA